MSEYLFTPRPVVHDISGEIISDAEPLRSFAQY